MKKLTTVLATVTVALVVLAVLVHSAADASVPTGSNYEVRMIEATQTGRPEKCDENGILAGWRLPV